MSRRRSFDPAAIPLSFWRRQEVQTALAQREIGRLFGLYLDTFPACTRTQLAWLTEHGRADISNFVRGARSGRVNDIDVRIRVADGLRMPDEARVLCGLAPDQVTASVFRQHPSDGRERAAEPSSSLSTGWFLSGEAESISPCRVAICGSRTADTEDRVIDEAVLALSRILMRHRCEVQHGPVGVGIEVMTYTADHYRPPGLDSVVGRFGRPNVVGDADYVIVVGGGQGTQDEMDLATSMRKRIIPLPATGGTAGSIYAAVQSDSRMRDWMRPQDFAALETYADADSFTNVVEKLLEANPGAQHE